MGSDWQARANERHDERHTKGSDEPSHHKHGGRKNRRDWCRGKVGVEHVTECVTYSEAKGRRPNFLPTWRVLLCKTCNKSLKTYAPFGPGKEASKPDWVTC